MITREEYMLTNIEHGIRTFLGHGLTKGLTPYSRYPIWSELDDCDDEEIITAVYDVQTSRIEITYSDPYDPKAERGNNRGSFSLVVKDLKDWDVESLTAKIFKIVHAMKNVK